MKAKLTILFCVLHFAFCIDLCAVDNILLNGVSFAIDTTAVYPIGPSTKYIAMTLTRADGKLLHVYQTIVNRTNKYISFEAHVGRDSILGGEIISKVAKRHTSPGHHLFTGHNGDFYVTQGDVGLPTAACVVDNQLAYTPNNSRPVAAYAEDGTPFAGQFRFNGTATHNGVELNINHVNYNRLENELVLYNNLQGKYTRVNEWGTEVVVVLAEGEVWGINREIKVIATEYRYRKVGAIIPKNGAVLSGHGTAAVALDAIAEGDTIVLKLNTTLDGEEIAITNCVGGDPRALMLKDGKVETNEIWDELHPRTGWGFSQTGDSIIYCIVDGRGISMGCNTRVLAEIMQSAGAYTAINLDGGGSSSLYVDPYGPMNNCSDGTERAVSNGMFVVNNAPEDDEISAISANIAHVDLPLYGTFVPHVLGYNKYGALINTNVTDFDLYCEPTVGHIEKGCFVASGNENGNLVISYKGAKAYVYIKKDLSAKMFIRLDSLVIDDQREYSIEVFSCIGTTMQSIQSKTLNWRVDDLNVCTIENGILKGINNGSTMIYGELGKQIDSFKVNVEIPVEPITKIVLNSVEAEEWSAKGSSSSWGTTLHPATEIDNAKLTFDYKTARAPYVQITAKKRLYSLPKKILLTLNPNNAKLDNIVIAIKANNASVATFAEFTNIESNKLQTLELDLSKVLTTPNDIAIYPIELSYIKFNINTSISKELHTIDLMDIKIIYGDNVVDIESVEYKNELIVYPNPAIDYIIVEGVDGEDVCVYSLDGQCVYKNIIHNAKCTIDVSILSAGTYIVKLGETSCKVIIK